MTKSNSDLKLPENPSLQDFQHYVAEMENVRGFTEETVLPKCLMLGEEVGELFKAIRKVEGLNIDENKSNYDDITEELADVFFFVISIANRYGIDLESAFRDKEAINKQRVWS